LSSDEKSVSVSLQKQWACTNSQTSLARILARIVARWPIKASGVDAENKVSQLARVTDNLASHTSDVSENRIVPHSTFAIYENNLGSAMTRDSLLG
jgi:hypothetical protein